MNDEFAEDYDLEYLLAEVPPEKKEILERIIFIDPRTGLYNLCALNRTLSALSSRIKRNDPGLVRVFSVFGDIDNFKNINETYGHTPSGNRVLRTAAQTLKSKLRDYDITTIYRYGGEEFFMLFFNIPAEAGFQITERLRESIEQNCRFYTDNDKILYPIQKGYYVDAKGESRLVKPKDDVVGVTMSFGIAEYQKEKEDFDTLIRRSGLAMKYSKEHGKNTTTIWTPSIQSTSS